ncbi:MAG: DUF177 domain-containing protein [Elusimicrobiales bacterium]|nr:DUF177 domain-containing protein [Elusimicrobiales bacterium]
MQENDPLVFKYADIRDQGGLNVKLAPAPAAYADAFDSPETLRKVKVELDFSVGGDSILLEGRVYAEMELFCSRCGDPLARAFEDSFDEVYPDSLEYIDTREVIRETVALLAPIKVLCSQACKGRCLVCGGNRNHKACGCQTQWAGSFEALKNLKLDKPDKPGKKNSK